MKQEDHQKCQKSQAIQPGNMFLSLLLLKYLALQMFQLGDFQ